MIIKYSFDIALIININDPKLFCQIPLPQQCPLFLQLGERTCFGYTVLTPDVAGKYLAVQKSMHWLQRETRLLPIPPIKQFVNKILLIWILQEIQNTLVKPFRVRGSVTPIEDWGRWQCKTKLPGDQCQWWWNGDCWMHLCGYICYGSRGRASHTM